MFLNKEKFKEELAHIFNEAQHEIVLVVPYIKISKEVFSLMKNATDRGIEILIICRTDGVKPQELKKIQKLNHITLMCHPNLHSKIYMNEDKMIIGSMNLYDYSEFFNREAGLMIENYYEEEWDDCKEEINEIISGAELQFESTDVKENGLDFNLTKTYLEEAYAYTDQLNKLFKTKTFRVMSSPEGDQPSCDNFYDNIAVVFSNRVAIFPKYDDIILKKLFSNFKNLPEDKFAPFRTYVSEYNKNFTIYAPKGKFIEEELKRDAKFAFALEKATLNLCKEIDTFYKEEYKKMQRI
jgi:hypothetical protein